VAPPAVGVALGGTGWLSASKSRAPAVDHKANGALRAWKKLSKPPEGGSRKRPPIRRGGTRPPVLLTHIQLAACSNASRAANKPFCLALPVRDSSSK